MRSTLLRLGTWAAIVLMPSLAFAQFEALRFVDLPAVGSWAQYQVSSGARTKRTIVTRKISFLSRQQVEGAEYYWFQMETQSDDYGPNRVNLTMQFAVEKQDVMVGEDLFRKIREMIVQVGDATAVRIAHDFLRMGVDKGLISGGTGGAGSNIKFDFQDQSNEVLTVKAGPFNCAHKRGVGKGEVLLSLQEPARHAIDSVRDIWYATEVPFGLVRQRSEQSGKDVATGDVLAAVESVEEVELLAFGTGAKSAIRGQVQEYSPDVVRKAMPASSP